MKKYNAYQPTKVKDGLIGYDEPNFDMTVKEWTPDDIAMFENVMFDGFMPEKRMAKMLANIDDLKNNAQYLNANPDDVKSVNSRIDKILYYYSEINNFNNPYKLDMANITLAIEEWKNIVRTLGLNNFTRMGKRKSVSTSLNASNKRPRKNYNGETLDSVISTLNKNHLNEKPSAVWVHLKPAIEEWSDGDCTEYGENDSRSYHYGIDEERGSITFGTFRRKLNK